MTNLSKKSKICCRIRFKTVRQEFKYFSNNFLNFPVIADFGGLLGLFLGCSLISIIEIFYFSVSSFLDSRQANVVDVSTDKREAQGECRSDLSHRLTGVEQKVSAMATKLDELSRSDENTKKSLLNMEQKVSWIVSKLEAKTQRSRKQNDEEIISEMFHEVKDLY